MQNSEKFVWVVIWLCAGLFVGFLAGLSVASWPDSKAIAASHNLAVAQIEQACKGKTVFLGDDNTRTSIAASVVIAGLGQYATKKEGADFVITADTKRRIGFCDIMIRNGQGVILYTYPANCNENAEQGMIKWLRTCSTIRPK